MRALSDRLDCSHDVSQKIRRIRFLSEIWIALHPRCAMDLASAWPPKCGCHDVAPHLAIATALKVQEEIPQNAGAPSPLS